MVLNILKRRKRTSDLPQHHSQGLFRQSSQGSAVDNNQFKAEQQKPFDYPSLTWDTLKRKRRERRESSLAESCVEEKDKEARRHSERYRSSPTLFQLRNDTAYERKKTVPKRLNETTWNTTGSLITLNFSSDDKKIIEETSYEDTEYEDTDDTLAHDDSGYYCDSDSGVSSLYDTINSSYTKSIQDSENEKDNSKCSEKSSSQYKISVENLEPALQHILTRDYRRTVRSEVFGLSLDLSSELPSSTIAQGFPLHSCCKNHLARAVINRQEELNKYSLQLREEIRSIDDKLSDLEEELKEVVTDAELKVFRRSVDQISAIVNLVFGLELRLSDAVYGTNPSMDHTRLCEAGGMKDRHDQSLHTVHTIVRERLGVHKLLTFRAAVRSKQRVLAIHRICKTEIYYVQALTNILTLF
jgi:hypothetical protein